MAKEVKFEITGTLSGKDGEDSTFDTFVVNNQNLMAGRNDDDKKINSIKDDVDAFKIEVDAAANSDAGTPKGTDDEGGVDEAANNRLKNNANVSIDIQKEEEDNSAVSNAGTVVSTEYKDEKKGGGLFRSPTANLKMALNNSFAKTIYKPNDFAKNMITNTVSTTLKNANPYGKKQHTKRAPSIFRQFSYKPKSRKSRKPSYRANKKSRSRK